MLAGIVGGDNVGMIQHGRRFDLPEEAVDGVLVLHRGRGQHLDGDSPLHPPVLGLEHTPHAARAELVENTYSPKTKFWCLPE